MEGILLAVRRGTELEPIKVEMSDQEQQYLEKIGRWVMETCLLYGTTPKTAFTVASMFVEGIEHEWSKQRKL
jgi:hypothetical protein